MFIDLNRVDTSKYTIIYSFRIINSAIIKLNNYTYKHITIDLFSRNK